MGGECGDKEVHQGDSTPSLSPESNKSSDKEGKERNDDENLVEDDLRNVQREELAIQATSRELCMNEGARQSGDTDTGDVDNNSSSEEDSVKEEEEPKKIVRGMSHSVERSAGEEVRAMDIHQEQCSLLKGGQAELAETSHSKNVEDDEQDPAQGHSSFKYGHELREELKSEKLEREEPMESSCESEEGETVKRKNLAGDVGRSDGE